MRSRLQGNAKSLKRRLGIGNFLVNESHFIAFITLSRPVLKLSTPEWDVTQCESGHWHCDISEHEWHGESFTKHFFHWFSSIGSIQLYFLSNRINTFRRSYLSYSTIDVLAWMSILTQVHVDVIKNPSYNLNVDLQIYVSKGFCLLFHGIFMSTRNSLVCHTSVEYH